MVVPHDSVAGLHPDVKNPSLKFIKNCEYRLFQRPDDAILRGYDKKTESDFSQGGLFFSNYEPIARAKAEKMVKDAIRFEQFTSPLRKMLTAFVEAGKPEYVVSSHQPRIVDGKATKNPRYLQNRPDLEDPRSVYLAGLGSRFYRRLPLDAAVPMPVNSTRPWRSRWTWWPPVAATTRRTRQRASARSRFTGQSTIRNCLNCSWISSPRSPAKARPPPARAAKAR